MNISQISLYPQGFILGVEQNKNGMKGKLDLAILGQASLSVFTLPFTVIVHESSRMQPQLRAKSGKVT